MREIMMINAMYGVVGDGTYRISGRLILKHSHTVLNFFLDYESWLTLDAHEII